MKDSFVFHGEWYDAIKDLDDKSRLEMFDAITKEGLGLEKQELSASLMFGMSLIRQRLNKDKEKYESICRRNKENGKKGGRPVERLNNPENPNNPVGFLETQKTQITRYDNNISSTTKVVSDNDIIEKEEVKDKSFPSKKERTAFTPPSLAELQAYIKEKNYHFDARSFIDYYEADDWHYGKGARRTKMTNWKRSCSQWEATWKRDHADTPDIFSSNNVKTETDEKVIINGQEYK